MPTLYRRKGDTTGEQSPWYIRVPNQNSPPPAHTFQLEKLGSEILRSMGIGHEDRFEMGEFFTIHQLGLTYTLGNKSDKSPSEVDVDAETVSEISPEQRLAFVERVLDLFSLPITSEAFYRVLLSLEDAPAEVRNTAIESLLEPTAIHPESLQEICEEQYAEIPTATVCRYFEEYARGNYRASSYISPFGLERNISMYS